MQLNELNLEASKVVSEEEILEILSNLTRKDGIYKFEELSTVLKNYSFQRYFKYNIEKYCKFISSIIENCNSPNDLKTLLQSDILFKRNLLDQEEFHSYFFATNLPAFMNILIKFEDDPNLFDCISKTVQKCIFNKNFKLFDAYLKGDTSNISDICRLLFKFIASLYNMEKYENTIGFRLIFHSFCNSYNNFDLIFRLLIILIEIIGFDITDSFNLKYNMNRPKNNIQLDYSLTILSELFAVLTKVKTQSDFAINNINFIDFIRNLLKSVIVLTGEPNNVCYRIISNAIEINPLLIEPIINEILIYIMLSSKRNLTCEYQTTIIQIIDVFAKLHRIQNLISKMIPTIKSGLEKRVLHNNDDDDESPYRFIGENNFIINNREVVDYNIAEILSKSVLAAFSDCVISLASWQVMNLFKTMLYHLNQGVIELEQSEQVESYLFVHVEFLGNLICCLLTSVRMAEHTIATTTVEKFVAGLKELEEILSRFGKILLHREHNTVLVRTFLHICYNWAEIYMIISYYSINNEIQMKIVQDPDSSACNLTYLHSYLSSKEWCLISERITNFGEQPCKDIMLKLSIQKLRSSYLFENRLDLAEPVAKFLALNIEHASLETLEDRFVVTHLIPKLENDAILAVADMILKAENLSALNNNSQIITRGVLTAISRNISKLLKQKRKCNEDSVKKTIFSKLLSAFPQDLFLGDCSDLQQATNILLSDYNINQNLDLKINSNKLLNCLEILTKLQSVIFCPDFIQKSLLILLFGLHRDIASSNFENELRIKCEKLIFGIIEHNKFDLLDLFNSDDLISMIINNFENFDMILEYTTSNILKSDEAIANFRRGVVCIKENLSGDVKYLRAALIILNSLSNKNKKHKISTNTKEIANEYRSMICDKIVKFLSKRQAQVGFIEAFALMLKIYFNKDENGNLEKLKLRLDDYLNIALMCDSEIKGLLLLFNIILQNKSAIDGLIKDDLICDIWNSLNRIEIGDEFQAEYSQVVTLIFTLISNEHFSTIFKDLLVATEKTLESGESHEIDKHLKTWTCIISSNFNTSKAQILRDYIELLLQKSIAIFRNNKIHVEIVKFQISIIQTNHLHVTSTMIDLFLITITLLMGEELDFVSKFELGVAMMKSLLKYRNAVIMDRLPSYLQEYRVLVKSLCVNADSNIDEKDRAGRQLQKVADCAHQLEKLTKKLVENSRDMTRIALYLIADILGEFELVALFPAVKIHLDNCVYSLISLCDQHAVQYLLRVLSSASSEIFKMMYANYKKYYRFTGKV